MGQSKGTIGRHSKTVNPPKPQGHNKRQNMNAISEYETQAEQFLKRNRISFSAKRAEDNQCPPFCDGKHIHGDKWRVTLTNNQTHRRVQFSFWNSQNDMLTGKDLDAYSVLACCSSDISCPSTFEDFCGEYGYDLDSRKAEKAFKLCRAQAERLQLIFDTEEIQAELGIIN